MRSTAVAASAASSLRMCARGVDDTLPRARTPELRARPRRQVVSTSICCLGAMPGLARASGLGLGTGRVRLAGLSLDLHLRRPEVAEQDRRGAVRRTARVVGTVGIARVLLLRAALHLRGGLLPVRHLRDRRGRALATAEREVHQATTAPTAMLITYTNDKLP